MIGALAAFQSQLLISILALIIVGVLAAALNLKVRLWSLSPQALLVVTYVLVGIVGPIATTAVNGGPAVGSPITLTPSEERGAYVSFIVAAVSTIAGALAYAMARPDGWLTVNRLTIRQLSGSARTRAVAGVLSLVPLGFEVISHGTDLLVRSTYLTGEAGDPVLVAASTLALPGIAVLGWLSQESSTRVGRLASRTGISVYLAVLFALGTRAFALAPLMAILGMIAARPSEYRLRIALILAAVGSLVLLELPLSLRGAELHGLIPYLGMVAHGFVTFDFSPLSNVLFAFQLTGRVAFGVAPLPASDLLISLDPRPGQLIGWYDIEQQLRVNSFIPYNAVGELANYGWAALVVFFVCVGAYLSHIDRRIRLMLVTGQAVPALLLFALACLFIVSTLQYNLRSNIRLIYYMIAIELAMGVLRWLVAAQKRRDQSPPKFRPQLLSSQTGPW